MVCFGLQTRVTRNKHVVHFKSKFCWWTENNALCSLTFISAKMITVHFYFQRKQHAPKSADATICHCHKRNTNTIKNHTIKHNWCQNVRRSKNASNNPRENFIWERQIIMFTAINLELEVIRNNAFIKACYYTIKWF